MIFRRGLRRHRQRCVQNCLRVGSRAFSGDTGELHSTGSPLFVSLRSRSTRIRHPGPWTCWLVNGASERYGITT
ncbi:hypothetical protein L1987_05805 [Smallanthus sonchifolius]|uniref:Uncharacterized protein n=1 Tax=Smallanthus sonchifolius TaxID=185202 RepID=A0ACB9JWH2_9ASTR|nr:hypothetical protein L1987_05805 [Smallanthus sonchifolius]